MDQNEAQDNQHRRRGRPAKHKTTLPGADASASAQANPPDLNHTFPEDEIAETAALSSSQGGHPRAFAALLGFVIRNNRNEVLRIAREVDVSDNTVYRWLNGTSEPRQSHLQRLLDALPQAQAQRSSEAASYERARSLATHPISWDVPKEIFRRVLEQAASSSDDASRHWHITETIFEYALLHLDPDRHGLALTYARLMRPHADGTIHALCEVEMRGQAPWEFSLDYQTYLGSTTLAGAAAIFQRVKTWSVLDVETRTPVGLDKNERSSCAAPVMRGGRMAGVLIVSSTLPDFVRNPAIPGAVNDYANLLATGLADSEFYPVDLIKLVPMPELDWQRDIISRTFLNRVTDCARMDGLSFSEAERKVIQDMAREFERHAQATQNAQDGQHTQGEQPALNPIDLEQS